MKRKHSWKRIAHLVLCLSLVTGLLLPTTAYADEKDKNKSRGNANAQAQAQVDADRKAAEKAREEAKQREEREERQREEAKKAEEAQKRASAEAEAKAQANAKAQAEAKAQADARKEAEDREAERKEAERKENERRAQANANANANAQQAASNQTSQVQGTTTIHVKPATLATEGGHSCNSNEWHFIINQLDGTAPASIQVTFVKGAQTQTVEIRLWKQSGPTAHYTLEGQLLDWTVQDASTTIDAGWGGQFVLSHGPCGEPNEGTLGTSDEKKPIEIEGCYLNISTNKVEEIDRSFTEEQLKEFERNYHKLNDKECDDEDDKKSDEVKTYEFEGCILVNGEAEKVKLSGLTKEAKDALEAQKLDMDQCEGVKGSDDEPDRFPVLGCYSKDGQFVWFDKTYDSEAERNAATQGYTFHAGLKMDDCKPQGTLGISDSGPEICPPGMLQLKVEQGKLNDRGANQEVRFTDGTLTVWVTKTNADNGPVKTFTWRSNIGVDTVLVKSGNSMRFDYNPEATSGSGHAGSNNGNLMDVSHIVFCYDVEQPTGLSVPSPTPTPTPTLAPDVTTGAVPTPTPTPATPVSGSSDNPTPSPTLSPTTPVTGSSENPAPSPTPTIPPSPTPTTESGTLGITDEPTPVPTEIPVCHVTGSPDKPFELIHVSPEALAEHLAHGDMANVTSVEECMQDTLGITDVAEETPTLLTTAAEAPREGTLGVVDFAPPAPAAAPAAAAAPAPAPAPQAQQPPAPRPAAGILPTTGEPLVDLALITLGFLGLTVIGLRLLRAGVRRA